MAATYDPTTLGERLRNTDGPAPGDAAPRWNDAPEPRHDENGAVVNGKATCPTCAADSTLCYRCSECGADLTGASS